MKFTLTNNDRKYLGLEPIEAHWEKVKFTDEIDLYFDGDTIKKEIVCSKTHYLEREMNELTAENRTILLPKTKKGKPKKLNYSSFSKRKGTGVYFRFDGYVIIANYTTQTTFLSTYENEEIPDFKALRKWLDDFIADTTPEDLQAINEFKKQERKHVKYKAGDFFRFKIDRRNYGYGRILFDVSKYRKTAEFKAQKNYGLANLMGRIITVKIYHTFGEKERTIDELKTLKAFPSQYIMDNRFYYGEYEIVGNLPLEDHELDFPISYSESIHSSDDCIYFQWGKIFKEINGNAKNKAILDFYRNEGVGFGLRVDKETLLQGIKENSNNPYWKVAHRNIDLRNPKNSKAKKAIFKQFGLDETKSYVENLKKLK